MKGDRLHECGEFCREKGKMEMEIQLRRTKRNSRFQFQGALHQFPRTQESQQSAQGVEPADGGVPISAGQIVQDLLRFIHVDVGKLS